MSNYPQNEVITEQPVQSAIMPISADPIISPFNGAIAGLAMRGIPNALPLDPIIDCPLGLEFLEGHEEIIVKQEILMANVLNIGSKNTIPVPHQYSILNSFGQRVYYATEIVESDTGRLEQGCTRAFDIVVLDFTGRPVLHIQRQFDPGFFFLSLLYCCGTAGAEININLGDGGLLGTVVQQYNCCRPLFHVFDNGGNLVLKIVNVRYCVDCCCAWKCICSCSCSNDEAFNILLPDGACIGKITKPFKISDSDMFKINVPVEMEVRAKALILGAVLLIDYVFFGSLAGLRRSDYIDD